MRDGEDVELNVLEEFLVVLEARRQDLMEEIQLVFVVRRELRRKIKAKREEMAQRREEVARARYLFKKRGRDVSDDDW